METALRETQEEVGIKIESVEVLKELTRLYIPPSNFWVQPYVGVLTEPEEFIRQDEEVEALVEVRLDDVMDNSKLIHQELSTSYAQNVEVPAFALNGHIVWGATAMMLNEIKTLLKQLL